MTEDIKPLAPWRELRRWWFSFTREQRQEMAVGIDIDEELVREIKAAWEIRRQRTRKQINTRDLRERRRNGVGR